MHIDLKHKVLTIQLSIERIRQWTNHEIFGNPDVFISEGIGWIKQAPKTGQF